MLTAKIILVLILLVAVTNTLFSQAEHNQAGGSDPIAEYRTPKSNNTAEQELRSKRDQFYRRFTFGLPSLDQLNGGQITDCFAPGVRETFSLESKTILIGKISEAKAYFSDDRRNVYTEFLFNVESIIRDSSPSPVKENKTIVIARWGGKIRYSSEYIQEWSIRGLGMPKVSQRYLFFLERHDEEQFYYLWSGYSLAQTGISPIDRLDEKVMPPSSYKGKDESEFLRIVSESIK